MARALRRAAGLALLLGAAGSGGRGLRDRRERRDHESVRERLRQRDLHVHRERQPRQQHRARLPAAGAGRLDDGGRRLSRIRLALRAAPVAAHAQRRGGRRGGRADARGPRHLGLRHRRCGRDDGGGFSGRRGAREWRHPRARVADAGGGDCGFRDARRRQSGPWFLPVPRREPEHRPRAGQQRGRLHPGAILSRQRHGGSSSSRARAACAARTCAIP